MPPYSNPNKISTKKKDYDDHNIELGYDEVGVLIEANAKEGHLVAAGRGDNRLGLGSILQARQEGGRPPVSEIIYNEIKRALDSDEFKNPPLPRPIKLALPLTIGKHNVLMAVVLNLTEEEERILHQRYRKKTTSKDKIACIETLLKHLSQPAKIICYDSKEPNLFNRHKGQLKALGTNLFGARNKTQLIYHNCMLQPNNDNSCGFFMAYYANEHLFSARDLSVPIKQSTLTQQEIADFRNAAAPTLKNQDNHQTAVGDDDDDDDDIEVTVGDQQKKEKFSIEVIEHRDNAAKNQGLDSSEARQHWQIKPTSKNSISAEQIINTFHALAGTQAAPKQTEGKKVTEFYQKGSYTKESTATCIRHTFTFTNKADMDAFINKLKTTYPNKFTITQTTQDALKEQLGDIKSQAKNKAEKKDDDDDDDEFHENLTL